MYLLSTLYPPFEEGGCPILRVLCEGWDAGPRQAQTHSNPIKSRLVSMSQSRRYDCRREFGGKFFTIRQLNGLRQREGLKLLTAAPRLISVQLVRAHPQRSPIIDDVPM